MSTPQPHPEAIEMAHARPGQPVVCTVLAPTGDTLPAVGIIIAAVDPDTGEAWHLWAGLNVGQAIAFANEVLTFADEAGA